MEAGGVSGHSSTDYVYLEKGANKKARHSRLGEEPTSAPRVPAQHSKAAFGPGTAEATAPLNNCAGGGGGGGLLTRGGPCLFTAIPRASITPQVNASVKNPGGKQEK